MRSRLVLVAVVVIPSAVRAQDAAPPAPTPAPVVVTQTVVVEAPQPGPGEPYLGLDLLVGQMSGIRPSVAIHRSDRTALVVEGFYGGLLTKLGQSEGAGAGVRWNVSRGGRDAVTLGPGVDVLFNFRDGQATILAPTVDLAWRRDFGERVGWTLGINAGVGVGMTGDRDHHGGSAAGRVTPLISVFGGLRF